MKNPLFAGSILLFGASISFTLGAARVPAQGPAGSGAAAAAQGSSHSINPLKWAKKDPKSESPGTRTDVEKKLTPALQAQGVLPANVTLTHACAPFTALDACLAALHASHNLGVDFNCLRAGVTGVHTSADVSGCKLADGDKSQSLHKAIHQLKPGADAKQSAHDAEQQAKDDLQAVSG